jgi:lysine-N-methylase
MILRKSAYFDDFRCIASACPDSCCKEWDVQVDAVSAEFYRNLTGALGDRLRSVLQNVDGEAVMTIEDGRCPMWRQDGLCRIQAELGEEALCHVCAEFPRLTHDYGDFIERGLELSCPEAARMILSAAPAPFIEEQTDGGEAEYDEEAMDVLLRTREQVLEILADNSRSVGETLALALLYGYQAQGELDGDAELPFDPQAALESAAEFARNADWELWREFFLNLEILTPEWKEMLENPAPAPWSKEFPALARYFVERYWLQAVSDYDLACRVKFMVIACLTVKLLGGDIYRTAQLFSKEIENNTDNVEAILDAAYAYPAFTDDKLLGMLLGR